MPIVIRYLRCRSATSRLSPLFAFVISVASVVLAMEPSLVLREMGISGPTGASCDRLLPWLNLHA